MIRPECGTIKGALAHQQNGEAWCGWCVAAERVARLSAEGIPARPPPPPASPAGPPLPYRPVTADQARRNAQRLLAEVEAYERGTAEAPSGRNLRSVS